MPHRISKPYETFLRHLPASEFVCKVKLEVQLPIFGVASQAVQHARYECVACADATV